MSPEHEYRLMQNYPNLFADTFWGFECGDGWFKLIDDLCCCIIAHNDDVRVDQVKEKFGQLRFYVTGGDRVIDGMIALAEHISGGTCEQCGQEGRMRSGGWIVTLCDKHSQELDLES